MADSIDGVSSPSCQVDMTKGQEDLLLCLICAFRLDDPKDLECRHSFCKACLDALLKFKDDGSATIDCPMRCEPSTVIKENKTTNDLMTSYSFKGLLEWHETQEKRLNDTEAMQNCEVERDCKKEISAYCKLCNIMMCQSCQNKHSHAADDDTWIPLKFDQKTLTQKAVCRDHNTFAEYVCCDKEFVCIYCKERKHKTHEYETLKNASDRIKGNLPAMVNEMSNKALTSEKIVSDSLRATNEAINDIRSFLKSYLRKKMLKCFTEYISLLMNEERRLLGEFETFAAKQMECYTKYNRTNGFHDINSESDLRVVLEEDHLLYRMLTEEMKIPSFIIGIDDSKADGSNPLGLLKKDLNEEVPLREAKGQSSVLTDLLVSDDNEEVEKMMSNVLRLHTEARQFLDEPTNSADGSNNENTATETAESRNNAGYLPPSAHSFQRQATAPSAAMLDSVPSSSPAPSFQSQSTIEKVVEVTPGRRSFGITLDDTPNGPQVKFISDSNRCRELRVNDFIISINDINVQHMDFSEAIRIMRNCLGDAATKFLVRRSILPPQGEYASPSRPPEIRNLQISRGPRGFGFTISETPLGSVVCDIRDEVRCTGLSEGDIILQINQDKVQHLSYSRTVQILKNCAINVPTNFQVMHRPRAPTNWLGTC